MSGARAAVILCGGEGRRFGGKPKALCDIAGRTLLRRSVEKWSRFGGVDRFVLVTNRNTYNEEISAEVDTWPSRWHVDLLPESAPPQGLASALRLARGSTGGPYLDNQFFVILGDQLFGRFELLDPHAPGDACAVGVLPHRESAPELIELNYGVWRGGYGRVIKVVEKPGRAECASGSPNCGIGFYVLDERIWPHLERTPRGARGLFDLTDAIQRAIYAGVPFWPLHHKGRWTHITTEQDYEEANRWFGLLEEPPR